MSAVDKLLAALELGEGFQLFIAVTDSVERADQRLGELQRRLGAQLGRPARVSRHAGWSASEELRRLELVLALPGRNETDLTVIDAIEVSYQEEPAWEEVFRWMNLRRNELGRALDHPLLLCVSPRMEVTLAHQAPDLRSIAHTVLLFDPATSVDTPADLGEPLTALAEALSRLYPDPRDGLGLMAALGLPPGRLPSLNHEHYWEEVLRRLERGVLPGGVAPLARRLVLDLDVPAARAWLTQHPGDPGR